MWDDAAAARMNWDSRAFRLTCPGFGQCRSEVKPRIADCLVVLCGMGLELMGLELILDGQCWGVECFSDPAYGNNKHVRRWSYGGTASVQDETTAYRRLTMDCLSRALFKWCAGLIVRWVICGGMERRCSTNRVLD
jgi:hypothetical protein